MASTQSQVQGGPNPNFFLTPQQQRLLFAALNSNKPAAAAAATSQSPVSNKPLSLSPESLQTSPVQENGLDNFHETPFLDNYDYDFGDSSFDVDFANDSQSQLIGDIPGQTTSDSPENESSEKRDRPDDDDDDDDEVDGNGNGAKRRESTEKVPKKPGRKPLTSEPSSKRKAQNRAAQRAFRERKEKHLKDLETKVDELQKASEDANHENGLLRAQIDRMTTELNEYKSRVSLMNNRSLAQTRPRNNPASSNSLSDVSFQFEFPKFGVLPTSTTSNPANSTVGNVKKSSPSSSASPGQMANNKPLSPPNSKESSISPGMSNGSLNLDDASSFSALFSSNVPYGGSMSTSRASMDSALYQMNNGTSTSSPSTSSQSHGGPSSSCGTSPEPFTQSPMGFKPVDTMTTIGEEQAGLTTGGGDNSLFAGIDPNSFDWLAQQNGGHFDPQLFGNYREPQENVLSTAGFDDGFFKDALDTDFFMPYNMAPSPATSKKGNLIDQIDAAQNADDDLTITATTTTPGGTIKSGTYGCTEVWEKLQNCPKVQNGEFDLDNLCADLQKKAKCSGSGPIVSETDFETVMKKWLGNDTKCIESWKSSHPTSS